MLKTPNNHPVKNALVVALCLGYIRADFRETQLVVHCLDVAYRVITSLMQSQPQEMPCFQMYLSLLREYLAGGDSSETAYLDYIYKELHSDRLSLDELRQCLDILVTYVDSEELARQVPYESICKSLVVSLRKQQSLCLYSHLQRSLNASSLMAFQHRLQTALRILSLLSNKHPLF